jgi:hypothetical protein
MSAKITPKNRLKPVFSRLRGLFIRVKTATETDQHEEKLDQGGSKEPVTVWLHDRFFPTAATGLQNTSSAVTEYLVFARSLASEAVSISQLTVLKNS